jgi:hypothetical protein
MRITFFPWAGRRSVITARALLSDQLSQSTLIAQYCDKRVCSTFRTWIFMRNHLLFVRESPRPSGGRIRQDRTGGGGERQSRSHSREHYCDQLPQHLLSASTGAPTHIGKTGLFHLSYLELHLESPPLHGSVQRVIAGWRPIYRQLPPGPLRVPAPVPPSRIPSSPAGGNEH